MPKCNVRSSNTGIIISDDDCWRVSSSDGSRPLCEYKYPFDISIHQSQTLFNIQTGKAAWNKVKTYLLDIRHTGEERHKNFVRECLDNPICFEEPIKRVKLLTFKKEGISNRRSTNRNIAELKFSRDLMGRFLFLATRRHLDLSNVFTFPLTPVPLSLCYCDGTMAKTEKTALFRHLESKVESSFPSSASVDACVVDESFLLRVLPPNLPATYDRLAATILIQTTALSNKRVDIIFDTYEMPSIKRMERERGGTCDRNYNSIGPQQRHSNHQHSKRVAYILTE